MGETLHAVAERWRSVLLASLVSVASVAPVGAQPDTVSHTARHDTAGGGPTGASVVFDGDTLFALYAMLGPFSASERAAAIADRLPEAVVRVARGDTVTVVETPVGATLSAGQTVIMTLLPGDAAPVGVAPHELARRDARVLQRALTAAAERTSLRAVLEGTALALAATGVLVLLLWAMAWGFPRLQARFRQLRRTGLRGIRIQRLELLSAGQIAALLHGASRVARAVLTILLVYFYVPLVLGFFPWTAPLSHRIIDYALRPFAAAGSALVAYVPSLFYLAGGVIIVRYLLALLRLLFGAVGTGAITIRQFYPEWADPTYKIVRVLVLALAAVVLYPYLPGASSDAFKGVSIFLGVLFSLGSSSAISNMVAGVVLTYTRAFQLGDRVQIGETVGDVTEKTLLVTRLRTIKNVAVTIPNGTVLSNHVVNYSTLAKDPGLILHTAVTIGYSAPWRRVHGLLLEAARQTEHVASAPAPFVLQTALDDFYVQYELNAYTTRPDLMAGIYSALHANIQESFAAGGVEIMSPHYRAMRDGNESTIPDVRKGDAAYEPAAVRAPSSVGL